MRLRGFEEEVEFHPVNYSYFILPILKTRVEYAVPIIVGCPEMIVMVYSIQE
jgi:hypothetical protein